MSYSHYYALKPVSVILLPEQALARIFDSPLLVDGFPSRATTSDVVKVCCLISQYFYGNPVRQCYYVTRFYEPLFFRFT